jgi:hypothetical protein
MKKETQPEFNRFIILPVPTSNGYPKHQIYVLRGKYPMPFYIGKKPLIYDFEQEALANVNLLIKYSKSFIAKVYDNDNVIFHNQAIIISGGDNVLVSNPFKGFEEEMDGDGFKVEDCQ